MRWCALGGLVRPERVVCDWTVDWCGQWAQIPTSPYEFVVLDCTLRRVFYVLPVAEPPLVKHPSTKLAEVLLSGYAVDNG